MVCTSSAPLDLILEAMGKKIRLALSVLRFFLDTEKLNPDGFQYAGYADTRPTGDNTTAAGRQKNRRVEITVLRQLQP